MNCYLFNIFYSFHCVFLHLLWQVGLTGLRTLVILLRKWLGMQHRCSGKQKQKLYQQAKQHTDSCSVLQIMLKLICMIPLEKKNLLEFNMLGWKSLLPMVWNHLLLVVQKLRIHVTEWCIVLEATITIGLVHLHFKSKNKCNFYILYKSLF